VALPLAMTRYRRLILLAVVLGLYWAYDKIVGIDNVKLGG